MRSDRPVRTAVTGRLSIHAEPRTSVDTVGAAHSRRSKVPQLVSEVTQAAIASSPHLISGPDVVAYVLLFEPPERPWAASTRWRVADVNHLGALGMELAAPLKVALGAGANVLGAADVFASVLEMDYVHAPTKSADSEVATTSMNHASVA